MTDYTLQIRRNVTHDYNLVVLEDGEIETVFLAADRQTLIDAVQEYDGSPDAMSLGQWSGGPAGVSAIEAREGGYSPDDYGELIAIRGNDGRYIERDEAALAHLIETLQD